MPMVWQAGNLPDRSNPQLLFGERDIPPSANRAKMGGTFNHSLEGNYETRCF